MDAAAEIGRNPVSTRFSLSMEMGRPTRDGTAEPVSRDQILRHVRGLGNIHFPCSVTTSRNGNLFTRLIHLLCYIIIITLNKGIIYCLRENISFDTLIRRSSRGHNSRKATQPSHCGTCLILLIFIAKRVQPSLPSSTLGSNFVYPRQISRSPRVGHCMS